MADYAFAVNGANAVGYVLPSWVPVMIEPTQSANIASMAVSKDGALVAFGLQSFADRLTIYVPDPTGSWVLQTGTPAMAAGAYTVSSLAFSNSGGRLAVFDGGEASLKLKVFNTATWGSPVASKSILYDADGGIAFSPDDAYLAVGRSGYDTSGLFVYETVGWTLVAGTPVHNIIYALGWSPDGTKLALATYDDDSPDNGVFVYETTGWTRVGPNPLFAGTAYNVAWHPAGSFLAVRTTDAAQRVRIYETTAWTMVGSLGSADGVSAVTGIGFTPDGAALIITQSSGSSTFIVVETTGWTIETASRPTETQAFSRLAVSPPPPPGPEASMVADAIGASIFSGEVLLLTIVDMTDSATGASTLTAGAIFSTELLSSALAASTMTVGVLVPASMISAATGATTLELQATLLASMFSYAAGNSVVPVDGTGQAAWAINTETNASTRYEGYAFNSFARIGDSYYGAKSDGIHRLEGDTDNGEPIQAMVSFGRQDFGTTAKKRITNAYVGASSAGRLFMRITADGQDYTYAARSSSEQLREQRFDVGRGLSANLLEFELYNADGDDFELASVEFAAVALTRRI